MTPYEAQTEVERIQHRLGEIRAQGTSTSPPTGAVVELLVDLSALLGRIQEGPGLQSGAVSAPEGSSAVRAVQTPAGYAWLFECSTDAMFTLDAAGRFTSLNPAGVRLTGYTADELCRMHFVQACAPDQLDNVTQRFRDTLAGQPQDFEAAFIHKDGRRIEISVAGTPLLVDDRVVGALGIARDMSARHAAEQVLRESERAFRTLADNAPDRVWRLDRNLRLLYFNSVAERAIGRQLAECRGKTRAEMGLPRGVADALDVACRTALATGETQEIEVVSPAPDGRPRHFLARIVPEYGPAGTIESLLGISTDITAMKEHEGALRTSERAFKTLADNAPDIVWRMDTNLRFLYVNPAFERANAAPSAMYLGKTRAETGAPEDVRQALDGGCRAAIATRRPQEVQACRRRKDGVDHHYLVRVVPETAPDGTVISVMGVSTDITERKKAEDALRESEARYRLLVETHPDAVLIHTHSQCVYVNPAGVKLFGATAPEDLLGRSPLELASPAFRETIAQRIERNWRGEGPTPLRELQILRLDAQTLDVETTAHPFVWRGEAAIEVILRDITVRKRAQAELKALNDTLEQRVAQRTAQLAAANTKLHEEIAQRALAEEQIKEYQARLRALASELSLTQERERRALARDMHDGLCQLLNVANLKLSKLRDSRDDTAREDLLRSAAQFIRDADQSARSLTFELSPPALYDLGFVAAAEWLAENIEKQYAIRVTFTDDGRPKPIEERTRVILFRCLRELLINTAKHAGVKEAAIRLVRADGLVAVTVTDRGAGFDPAAVRTGKPKGFGLFSIREQLDAVGGSIVIHSAPGTGTTITLTAPVIDGSASTAPSK